MWSSKLCLFYFQLAFFCHLCYHYHFRRSFHWSRLNRLHVSVDVVHDMYSFVCHVCIFCRFFLTCTFQFVFSWGIFIGNIVPVFFAIAIISFHCFLLPFPIPCALLFFPVLSRYFQIMYFCTSTPARGSGAPPREIFMLQFLLTLRSPYGKLFSSFT